MNRSVERRRFLTRGVPRGEVRVGWFDHPIRGPVRCSAAPLLAGGLRGRRVSEGFLPVHEVGDTVLFTASYLDVAGDAVGLAAAARADDHEALHAAEEAVASWAAIWRTRRLLVAVSNPVCSGARRARQMVEARAGEAYVVGGKSLESAGLATPDVTVVSEVTAIPAGGTVVFPPYGASPTLRAEVAGRGLSVLDTICPLADAMRTDVRRFADRGDTVLIIGKAGHAAVEALAGEAPGATVLIESLADIRALRADPARLSYLISGGVPVEDVFELVAALRARFPRLRGQHPDGLCYAASDHVGTVRAVAAACEVILVLGAENSSNTRDLADQAAATGAETHRLADITDIRPGWLADAATVGLITAPSAKPRLREEVIEAMSGLGPLSVVRRSDVSEVVKIQGFR